jgi:hypothetical protein
VREERCRAWERPWLIDVVRLLVKARVRLVATTLVMYECGNAAARKPYRADVAFFREELRLFGKPSPIMMRAARKELGLATDETVMIGDTMETDILGGVQLGFHTVLVLSGGTKRDDLPRYAYRPEFMFESLGEFAAWMEKRNWAAPWSAAPVKAPARTELHELPEGNDVGPRGLAADLHFVMPER